MSIYATITVNAQTVTNGSFEVSGTGSIDTTDVEGWLFQTAEGISPAPDFEIVSDTVEQGDRALKVVVHGLGINQWDIQAVADSIHVIPGATYDYSIWAKAEKPGAQVNFTVGNFSYSEYQALRPAYLTTQWQKYTMQFTVNDNQTIIRAPIHFNYAEDTSNAIYIDNLQIVDIESKKPVIVEAESGELGSNFTVKQDSPVTYITAINNYTGLTSPGDTSRIATYHVTFPNSGFYNLFVRLRVGPGGYDDDSFFYGKGFGVKSVTSDTDWVSINGLASAGFSGPNDVVDSAGTLGSDIWKWVNVTKNSYQGSPGDSFYVSIDSLTQTFQIGSREDGLDIDKFAFGKSNLYFTVSNLDNGEAGETEIPNQNLTLSVDLSNVIRPVTHCASGALYGITETLPGDVASLVAPLNPDVYVQPARAGSGHQQPFGAAIPVSARLNSTTGQVMIRLADLCPGWPYQWPGESSWISQVTSVINDKKTSDRNNYYGYEIWNERHGTWQASNGDFYTLCWKPTYDLIRLQDSSAKIIGPSDSYYSRSRISEFLTYCKNNNCLPDIICWHELQGSANVSIHINDYRSLEKSLGISPLPISINEYCDSNHENEGCPGTSAPFIAKFERNKISSASISWWFTNLPGRLGSLLTAGNEKGGGWWFYKWYGDMTGNMVSVIPTNENSTGIDGFACLDSSAEYASICFGGNNTGMMDVVIDGIPSTFGDSVYAKVEYVPWSDKDAAVSGTETVSTTNYAVSNGTITVPVDVTNPLYGYRVFVTSNNSLLAVNTTRKTIPYEFSLSQNYPNPFNPTTTIDYQISKNSMVTLKVYDILGREVVTLVNKQLTPGKYSVKFDGSNLSSGIYFYRLDAGSFVKTKKLILLK